VIDALQNKARRTIASNDEKLIILPQLVYRHIWECRNNLLFGREIRALLELEIANGSAQREVAIDAAKVDKSTCCADTCLLAFVLWLVIE